MRHRPRRAVVAAIGIAISVAACTGSSAGRSGDGGSTAGPATPSASIDGATFTGHGVSFSYPSTWTEFVLSDSSASTGGVDWEETVGMDGRNIVSVARYTLDVAITQANIRARTPSIGSQIESLFTQAGGAVTAGPTAGRLGGMPALSFDGTVRTPSGQPVTTRLLLAFDGTTEYAVTCQYDRSGRDEIRAGCQQIASTFSVTG